MSNQQNPSTTLPGLGNVARSVDVWDAAAHLESNGVSTAVARQQGFTSVFDFARKATGQVEPDRSLGAPETRQQLSMVAAFQRSLMMLGGVIICVTTLPTGAQEGIVFAIAAAGWLAGQLVSAAVWFAWSHGRLSDGVRAAAVSGSLVLFAGIIGAVASQQWTLLVWVGLAIAIPVLQLMVAGWRLTLAVVGGAAVSGLAWLSAESIWWPQPSAEQVGLAASAIATVLSVGGAALLVVRELRSVETRDFPGTNRAIMVAGTQTAAQLAMLLVIFYQVGPDAFGSIAVAGLAAGVLADPLFVAARVWSRQVSRRSTSWHLGRLLIGVVGIIVVAVMVWASLQVTFLLLARPFMIFLNAEAILLAAMLVGALIAVTNVMLRTGSATGAMVTAILTALATAATVLVPVDAPIFNTMLAVLLVVVLVTFSYVTAERLSRPASW